MNSYNRELVQYNGIHTCMSPNLSIFRQQNLDHIFCIPCNKPNIDHIFKVWVESFIVDFEVVKTSKGFSFERQQMTGFNLFVCGNMKLKFEYVSGNKYQSIHTTSTIFPFCAFVALPENFEPNSSVYPIIYIEDILTKKVNSTCIYTNITFTLSTDICKEVNKNGS